MLQPLVFLEASDTEGRLESIAREVNRQSCCCGGGAEMWGVQCHTNRWLVKTGQLSPEGGHVFLLEPSLSLECDCGASSGLLEWGPLVPSALDLCPRCQGLREPH